MGSAPNAVAPCDWADYLHKSVDATSDHAPLDGLLGSGWKLVYSSVPNPYEAARGVIHHFSRSLFSVGFTTNANGMIGDVLWNSAAFKSGLAPHMKLISVNGLTFSPEVFLHAIADSSKPGQGKLVFVASGDGTTNTCLHPRLRRGFALRVPAAGQGDAGLPGRNHGPRVKHRP